MSVVSYTKGCHLLNHDDVIGTRRVSYILYMPLPHYTLWQKDWGGALELYPVQMGEDGMLEPEAVPVKTIPPSWNQFILFEVQPGKSFHSVEEVVVGGEGEDGRERLSISGWFHAAQEGEDGYTSDAPVPEIKSSREQLVSVVSNFRLLPPVERRPLDLHFHCVQTIPRITRTPASRYPPLRRVHWLPLRIPKSRLPPTPHDGNPLRPVRRRIIA